VISAAFVIPFWADILAIGIGALQGALFAAQYRDRRLDLLGVAIVGIASGFGGGLVRDVLLAEVPAALQSNWYLPVAVAAALLGMLLERVFSRLNSLITVLDALTIGLFGAIGTTKALSLGVPEVPAVFVGVISAVGGSILRDILLNTPIALMHVGSLYAVAALLGCFTLVALVLLGVPVIIAAIASVAITFGVRVLAVLFNWSLPEQRRLERIPRLPRLPRLTGFPHGSKDRNAATRAGSPRTGSIPRVGVSTQTGSIARVNPTPSTGSIARTGSGQPPTGTIPKQSPSKQQPATRPISTARVPRALRRKPKA
jgi:uncharacterized membrane protein YeiH